MSRETQTAVSYIPIKCECDMNCYKGAASYPRHSILMSELGYSLVQMSPVCHKATFISVLPWSTAELY